MITFDSGMLHTGFDAPADSLELQCITYTFPRMFDVLQGFGLVYDKIGATMVAWTQEQVRYEISKYLDTIQKTLRLESKRYCIFLYKDTNLIMKVWVFSWNVSYSITGFLAGNKADLGL